MKILTTNFLTCAVKTCKTSPQSYPLHFRDATLERTELDFNPLFMRNILPRVNWDALKTTAEELGLSKLVPDTNPIDVSDGDDTHDPTRSSEDGAEGEGMEIEGDDSSNNNNSTTVVAEQKKDQVDEEVLKGLHGLLLETSVNEGKLVCGNCGFEYPIKDGVGNFLLPAHLV